jgi:hypothetical protein
MACIFSVFLYSKGLKATMAADPPPAESPRQIADNGCISVFVTSTSHKIKGNFDVAFLDHKKNGIDYK